ncbi:MAG: Uma2 family endonuclease [Planctomycetes bacterium]|nr:Uma2 family endonuclease [Planctomycetota bacterium]
MATGFVTAAEMQEQLGGIPLERIRMVPPPGLATEQDLLRVQNSEDRICELIDGVLVEKTMGYFESRLAMILGYLIQGFVEQNDLGIVLGADGTLRILGDQIRVPDVAFLSWRHFPGRVLPAEPVPALAPDLAVEVLSKGNTRAEMERKLDDYFIAGVRLVWFIDPASQSATVYEDRDRARQLSLSDSLTGGSVLPGFELPLQQLFDKAGRRSGSQQ